MMLANSGATLLQVPKATPDAMPGRLPNRFRPPQRRSLLRAVRQLGRAKRPSFRRPAPPPRSIRPCALAPELKATTLSQRRIGWLVLALAEFAEVPKAAGWGGVNI